MINLAMHNRRQLLQQGLIGLGIIATSSPFLGCRPTASVDGQVPTPKGLNFGPLQAPDENGLRLAAGFSSRIVARSGQRPTSASDYVWHGAPDGGACFAAPDGGWIYVSNSELPDHVNNNLGGVGALRFDRGGNIVAAYAILTNTRRNCAGGPTPWGTWLSCEEDNDGLVYECDPLGQNLARPLPALGIYEHEAVAYEPTSKNLYLTEDNPHGLLYRFVPASFHSNGYPDFRHGQLQALQWLNDGSVKWLPINDPSAASKKTREQAPEATIFRGGEGIWQQAGIIYFATKHDTRIWALDTRTNRLRILYDRETASNKMLNGVDNLVGLGNGNILIAEDNDDNVKELMAMNQDGQILPLLQVVGHAASELCGPAFSPDGSRLYFSSQRGTSGLASAGITFEVSGPFFQRS